MTQGGVKSMKTPKSNIARNLTTLRQLNRYSQEDVAEQIGVSRQAAAKRDSGAVLKWAEGVCQSLCRIGVMPHVPLPTAHRRPVRQIRPFCKRAFPTECARFPAGTPLQPIEHPPANSFFPQEDAGGAFLLPPFCV